MTMSKAAQQRQEQQTDLESHMEDVGWLSFQAEVVQGDVADYKHSVPSGLFMASWGLSWSPARPAAALKACGHS